MVREESGVGGGAVVQESTAMLREWGRMLRSALYYSPHASENLHVGYLYVVA